MRKSKAKLDGTGAASVSLPPIAPCAPKKNFFTRNREPADWFRTLTQPKVRRALSAVIASHSATPASGQPIDDPSLIIDGYGVQTTLLMTILFLFLTHIAFHMLCGTSVVMPLSGNWNRRTVAYGLWLQARATLARFLRVMSWFLELLAYGIEPALVVAGGNESPPALLLPSVQHMADSLVVPGGGSAVNDTTSDSLPELSFIHICEICGDDTPRRDTWCSTCANRVLRLQIGFDTPADREFRYGQYVAVAHMFGGIDSVPSVDEVVFDPSPRFTSAESILNRIVRWCVGGIEYEADPRHVEKLLRDMNMVGCKDLSSPGVKLIAEDLAKESPLLEGDVVTLYRSGVARCNYLSVDRPDIPFQTKEPCRSMSQPRESGMVALKHLCRYSKGRPRLVQ